MSADPQRSLVESAAPPYVEFLRQARSWKIEDRDEHGWWWVLKPGWTFPTRIGEDSLTEAAKWWGWTAHQEDVRE